MGQKRELIKAGVGLIVGVGVSAIAGNAIGIVKPQNIGKIKTFCVGVGAIVLASMASDQAAKYTEEKIDEVADGLQVFLKQNENEEQKTEES